MNSWTGNGPLKALTLNLDGQIFALPAGYVREILDMVPVTEVPGSRPFVNGLINVRGKVVPLADLRCRFGMAARAATIDTRIIVIELELDGDPITVGLVADKVYEVTEIADADLEETPRIGLKWPQKYIRCVGKRGDDFIVVPDIDQLFS